MAPPTIDTDVLIVGSGPAGSAMALALSTYGVKNLVVTKYRWLADTPRAHITNSRTMEVLRDFGVEDEVNLYAAPQDIMGNTIFATSLAGEELGRIMAWGTHPRRLADYTMASPSRPCDMPQNLMEPILFGQACTRGTIPMFNTEYLSYEQRLPTPDYPHPHVVARVRNRLVPADPSDPDAGISLVRARFLVGADGGRSKVAGDAGLPFKGKMGVAGSVNVIFECDLSRYVAHRPSVLYWILQPGADSKNGGIGMGLVRMVRPWNEWLLIWGCPPEGRSFTDEEALAVVRQLVGVPDLDARIKSVSTWTVNDCHAERYVPLPTAAFPDPLVFCAGDAVHRHPPSNGLGSNTSIQDSYNLAWKLALVLRGAAGCGLLHSYDAERAPVGKQIVARANKSITEFAPIFDALGFGEGFGPEDMERALGEFRSGSAAGEGIRRALRDGIAGKEYEFNALGVEMNHSYTSSAVVPDASPDADSAPAVGDAELEYRPTTVPGHRLPHAWLFDARGRRVSTLDLCGTRAGKPGFAVFTGLRGEAVWGPAAGKVGKELGVEVRLVVVGPGKGASDFLGEWAAVSGIGESGAVLVRPDQMVGWRKRAVPEGEEGAAGEELREAMKTILAR
ncbi:2-polyprenyl-6-methoxyphenol hydroxylase-like oxidoreductase [Hyaloraphidium curvatum]|nr:2-polyprenyl-6-methoxyphenol hydroxylase-like oxidoreductase [Hyaloraphidium curvatum]